jgi:hypothetical protein
MRKISLLLVVVLCIVGTQAFAQNAVLAPAASDSGPSFPKITWPRPFIYGGLGLNGGGYTPASGKVGAGLRIDSDHFIWMANAAYDNAHKSNDNTLNNQKGHERSLESSIYYRFTNGWFAGGGAGWSELSTTNYTKQQFHPSVGGGKDYFHKDCAAEDCVTRWSMRLQVDYKLKGTEHVDAKGCSVPNGQCTNDLQGPMLSFYMPSPAAKGHLFWRETVGIYRFHDTLTSTDPALTALQESHKSTASFVEFTMMYRF